MATVAKKKRGTYFGVGEKVKIYQKPLAQEDFEDEAELIECTRPYTEFHYHGLAVEEWKVRFPDDSPGTTWVRVIAVPSIPAM